MLMDLYGDGVTYNLDFYWHTSILASIGRKHLIMRGTLIPLSLLREIKKNN